MHGVNATCYVQVCIDYCDAVSEEFRESTAVFFEQENPGSSINIRWVWKDSTELQSVPRQNIICNYALLSLIV